MRCGTRNVRMLIDNVSGQGREELVGDDRLELPTSSV